MPPPPPNPSCALAALPISVHQVSVRLHIVAAAGVWRTIGGGRCFFLIFFFNLGHPAVEAFQLMAELDHSLLALSASAAARKRERAREEGEKREAGKSPSSHHKAACIRAVCPFCTLCSISPEHSFSLLVVDVHMRPPAREALTGKPLPHPHPTPTLQWQRRKAFLVGSYPFGSLVMVLGDFLL